MKNMGKMYPQYISSISRMSDINAPSVQRDWICSYNNLHSMMKVKEIRDIPPPYTDEFWKHFKIGNKVQHLSIKKLKSLVLKN